MQIFYAAAYGRVEAVKYLLETLPDKGLGVQFGLQWVRGDIHGGKHMCFVLYYMFFIVSWLYSMVKVNSVDDFFHHI